MNICRFRKIICLRKKIQRQSFRCECGITVVAQLLYVADIEEMLNCAVVVEINFCDRVAVVEKDAALGCADLKNLTVHFDITFTLPFQIF